MGTTSTFATSVLTTPHTTSTRANMTVLARSTARRAGPACAGAARTWLVIATVTAVELTSPPTSPVSPAPRRGPSIRCRT